MKREALNHTKMKRLCRRLNLPLWQGVGILETLWQLTAKQAPRGDVGRLSNEDIAIGLDYRENDLDLIEALVESGWVDRDQTHRLLIHDWADHAPDAIHMKLARQKLFFASGDVPKTNRLPKWEREEAHKFFGGIISENIKEPLPRGNFVRTNDDSVRTNEPFVRPPCAPPRPPPPPPPSPDPPISASLSTKQQRQHQQHPVNGAVKFPLVLAEIRKHDAAVDDHFAQRLMAEVIKTSQSPEFPPAMVEHITDRNVARCVAESYRTGPKTHGTGLLLKRVPKIVMTWSLE